MCGTVATAAFVLFPKQLVGLFLNPGDIAARIAIEGFPYIGAGFIFFIANLAVVGYYQSIGKVLPATCFAMLRGFMFLIPSFILLPRALGAVGIWLALPLSEILTAVVIAAVFVSDAGTPCGIRPFPDPGRRAWGHVLRRGRAWVAPV